MTLVEQARRSWLLKAGARSLRRASRLISHGPRPVILMYHRIADETFDPWGLAVSRTIFVDQLRWIAENRTVLPLVEFAERHGDGTLPDSAVTITFDDGYACFADTAVPLLREFELPATVFIPVQLVEQGRAFWWDELQRIVLRANREALHLNGGFVPLGAKASNDNYWKPGTSPGTDRQRAFARIWALLRPKRPHELDSAMAELRSQANIADEGEPLPRPMSPEEVRSIRGNSVEFGSHALTHPWLPTLSTSERRREIGESGSRCEALTGKQPVTFAYPYGAYDAESEKLVEESGYICALTTEERSVATSSRAFALGRVGVGNWPGGLLGRKLRRV